MIRPAKPVHVSSATDVGASQSTSRVQSMICLSLPVMIPSFTLLSYPRTRRVSPLAQSRTFINMLHKPKPGAQKSAHFLCYSQRSPSGLRFSQKFAGSDMKANNRKVECVSYSWVRVLPGPLVRFPGPKGRPELHQTPDAIFISLFTHVFWIRSRAGPGSIMYHRESPGLSHALPSGAVLILGIFTQTDHQIQSK